MLRQANANGNCMTGNNLIERHLPERENLCCSEKPCGIFTLKRKTREIDETKKSEQKHRLFLYLFYKTNYSVGFLKARIQVKGEAVLVLQFTVAGKLPATF